MPKVSIVIPALNEEKVIHIALQYAIDGLKAIDHSSEILVIDNGSTDRTVEIAKSMGARVITVPKRGLGQAYLDSIPHIQSDYIIMGDADGTYDFRESPRLVEKLDEGYEFVMGSRIKGNIEPGAMPFLHRYVGTPIMTKVLNLLFGTTFSDINCGLRGLTLSAFKRMNLQSSGWEYASEMVLKSALLKLKSTEVPVSLKKDAPGRVPHLQLSLFTPWNAAWRNLKMMLLFAPDSIFVLPGGILLTVGLTLLFALVFFAPIVIGPLYFDLHYMVLGSLLTLLGMQVISLGVYTKTYALVEFFQENDQLVRFFSKEFILELGTVLGGGMFFVGLGINLYIVYQWILTNYTFSGELWIREAILAMTLIVMGGQIVFSSLFLGVLALKKGNRDE